MLQEILTELFERDLTKLKSEINSYEDESKLWMTVKGINNSAGNLCMHLTGNLRHFIGAILGNTGYARNRSHEFTVKNVPKEKLISEIDITLKEVTGTLKLLSDNDLIKNFPVDVFKRKMTTAYFLTHLATHLNYHLGQINYHRRMI